MQMAGAPRCGESWPISEDMRAATYTPATECSSTEERLRPNTGKVSISKGTGSIPVTLSEMSEKAILIRLCVLPAANHEEQCNSR